MKRLLFFPFFLFSFWGISSAQTIKLHFPHFSNKPYALIIYRGDNADTINRGIIPVEGKLTFQVPLQQQKPYVGMARWIITSKEGGGFDMIIKGENFTVECLDEHPNERSIKFIGSAENNFLQNKRREQALIFQKLKYANQTSESFSPLFPSKEVGRIEQQYDSFRVELAKSKTYASQYIRFTNFVTGINDKIYKNELQSANAFDNYIANNLDWAALYTSNYWGYVIHQWVQMHLNAIKNDEALTNSSRRILARLPNNELYTEFSDKLVRFFVEAGKDALIAELSGEVKRSGRLTRTTGLLSAFTGIQKGDKALPIKGLVASTRTYNGGKLILFFESDCEHCKELTKKLTANYDLIKKKDIQVISIASDVNPDIYKPQANLLPWTDKICDFKGPVGDNFNNYGVVGTPTIFYIDSKGIVQGRFARWDEIYLTISAL